MPIPWVASVWKRMPRSRQRAARPATGWTVPISPFTQHAETTTVSGRIARSTAAALTMPSGSGAATVSVKPSSSSARME